MTKEELAERINNHDYGKEFDNMLLHEATESGLVICYGASDDLLEFEGAIYDEAGCYGGGTIMVSSVGLLPDRDEMENDEDLEQWLKEKKRAKKIQAIWCAKDEPAWTLKTSIPHATFNIVEDGEVQSRGIVFNLNDLN